MLGGLCALSGERLKANWRCSDTIIRASGRPVSLSRTRPRMMAVPVSGGRVARRRRHLRDDECRDERRNDEHALVPCPLSLLPVVQLAPGVEVVVIEDRVEHHEVTAMGFTAPDGVVREQDDVSFVDRHVDDHGALRDLAAAVEQP